MKTDDLVGKKFGRLEVVCRGEDFITKSGSHRLRWRCVCECGNYVDVLPYNLKRSNTKSCGCLNDETRLANSTKHGDRHTRLYSIWCNIKTRCYDPSSKNYERYGGRGITMCNEWKESYVLLKEWAVNNGFSDDDRTLSIDRIDVNGNYDPSNCRWATPKVQANNRRNTIIIEAHGETHTLSEWADITGERYHTLFARIYKLGWDPNKAIQTIK